MTELNRRALLQGGLAAALASFTAPFTVPPLAAIGGALSLPSPAHAADNSVLQAALERNLRRLAGRRPARSAASVLVASPSRGLRAQARLNPSAPDTFHAASVGKLFTVALIARHLEAGALRLDTPIAEVLPASTLQGLFVVDGHDHAAEVQLQHLLRHTSGAADLFSDPGGVLPLALGAPSRAWTPAALLDHAREAQRAVAPPGARFHYSDTGYLLLGRALEQLGGASFVELVHRDIFTPLGMDRSFYPNRSQPTVGGTALRPATLRGQDLSAAAAITLDEAGGGAATTEADLLRFLDALFTGGLLRPDTVAALGQPEHRFVRGLWCGAGLMRWRLGELSPALRRLPELQGHMGVLGVQAFRTIGDDLTIIVSMGSDDANAASARLMIAALMAALRPA
jgi:D-alanyl-D-alanine carboxypeptidase